MGQSRIDNTEPLETLGTQDTGRRQTKHKNTTLHKQLNKLIINGRENRRANKECTIQRHKQYSVQDT